MKNKNSLIFFISIFIFICTFFLIKYTTESRDAYLKMSEKILFEQANSLFQNMINTRRWSSEHGGVYIKAHDGLKENPYLDEGSIYTKDNELLIKINPAWMTRQISEISNKEGKGNYFFKITSLQPINPNNKADNFENEALNYLKKNENEKYYTKIEKNKFNFLGSLKVEESCLACHTTQNYKIGDNIGGLRVSVPINNHNQNIQMISSKTNLLNLLIVTITILLLSFIIFAINSIFKREKHVNKLNKLLEKKVMERTKELSLANEKLLEISTIDHLTNIPNRRYFFEMGNKAFHLAKRDGTPLSLICIDIDHFKNINDTFGHQVGDEILKIIATNMSSIVRRSDILARIGGEEFCILLNNTDLEGAKLLSEKLRLKINNFSHKKFDLKPTISLGITQMKEEDMILDSIMARADEALYEAKKTGRNKFVSKL